MREKLQLAYVDQDFCISLFMRWAVIISSTASMGPRSKNGINMSTKSPAAPWQSRHPSAGEFTGKSQDSNACTWFLDHRPDCDLTETNVNHKRHARPAENRIYTICSSSEFYAQYYEALLF